MHRILGGGNTSQLPSGAFSGGLKTICVVFSLSQRYQKAAEEATAEKRRSVSTCFLGSEQQPAVGVGHPQALLLGWLIFGV